MKDRDCVDLLQWALPRMDMRWHGFRKVRGQVCKRVSRRLAELGLESVAAYRHRLDEVPDEWEVLDGFCRVTISRFRRDRQVWKHLRLAVLPELADRLPPGGELRAWSAGCGSGEEPYTLAILWNLALKQAFPGVLLRVTATDAEPAVLERAKRAVYERGTLKELPEDWIEKAFDRGEDDGEEGGLTLRDPFREPVELLRQDLRRDMPEGPFHVVLCRNLPFTYFTPELQAEILERISVRTAPRGMLVIGAHESLPADDPHFEKCHRSHPIYRRRRTAEGGES